MRISRWVAKAVVAPAIFIAGLLPVWGTAAELPQSSSADTIINLPVAEAWNLFTTVAGLNSLGYAQAAVDLRLNGKLQTDPTGKLPALNAEISSFEPGRMLTLKHDDASWAVLYFQALGQDMTGLRWVEFAPPATDSQKLAALTQTHRELFNQLARRYAPECELCKKEKAAK